MQITVERGDLSGLAETLAARRDRALVELLDAFAQTFVAQARHFAPARSGRLRREIGYRMQPDGVLIEAPTPYSVYVLGGVRPGWMTKMVGHTIAFTAKDGTRVVRRVTRVGEWDGRRHWYSPGVPARDFFRQAWESEPVRAFVERLAANGVTLAAAFLYDVRYGG